jgi:hypothetical protein
MRDSNAVFAFAEWIEGFGCVGFLQKVGFGWREQ